jgi:dTDP-4-amino-4,6-dideoxygalactose transaminase
MGLSLREAAREAHISKSTVLRAIQSGRLSAGRTQDGGYDIDPAELFRVYPLQPAERTGTGSEVQHAPAAANGNTPDATAMLLQAQLDGLKEILRRADATADELRQDREQLREDRDKWRNLAENQQRQITDNRPRSLWQRLVG